MKRSNSSIGLPPEFVVRILTDFREGSVHASTAVEALGAGKTASIDAADVLQMELRRRYLTRQRSTGLIPLAVWEEALLAQNHRLRPMPVPSLLDLHLSQR